MPCIAKDRSAIWNRCKNGNNCKTICNKHRASYFYCCCYWKSWCFKPALCECVRPLWS